MNNQVTTNDAVMIVKSQLFDSGSVELTTEASAVLKIWEQLNDSQKLKFLIQLLIATSMN